MYIGSRKHILDWTGQPEFVEEFIKFLAPVQIQVPNEALYMPRGYFAPTEARLETFGPQWVPEKQKEWSALVDWWLQHKERANTPNWDIAMGCRIEDRPGLVLVEAKANWPELSTAGKILSDTASANSVENHEHIGRAVAEASAGWQLLDKQVTISRDSHYQLANRLAFTWKLAMLGFPVVLLCLGFTGDEGIRDVGTPFSDDSDWQNAFIEYARGTIPVNLFEKRLNVGPSPVWLLSRSRPVIEMSAKSVF